jgi:hypothetical protein
VRNWFVNARSRKWLPAMQKAAATPGPDALLSLLSRTDRFAFYSRAIGGKARPGKA